MAADYARYMHENRDVYNMYSDGGKWSWANGRQQGAYTRNDGSPLQAETAAQYAQNHYSNFGKREGRQMHEMGGTDYGAILMGGSSSQSSAPSTQNTQNTQISGLQDQVTKLTQSLADQGSGEATAERTMASNLEGLNSTVLTGGVNALKKKKSSYLTPIGAS